MIPMKPTDHAKTSEPFTAETTMGEAMTADPGLQRVLMQFHIGGCSHCGFNPQDTIAQVAEDHGVPLQVLLGALNGK